VATLKDVLELAKGWLVSVKKGELGLLTIG
jgi:hypothetical protein